VNPSTRFFFWLLLQDRLNTRGLLRRKHIQLDPYVCELCILQKEEKLRHLFLRCPFAKNCCMSIGVSVLSWLRPERATRHIKRSLGLSFCNGHHYDHVLEYLKREEFLDIQ
jgi:hypothetical protein